MKRPSLGPSHAWLFVCNLATFALTICVLIGCRTPSESAYSLINVDHTLLAASFGADCVEAGISVIPDVYKTGLAGACRVHPTTTTCTSSPPGHPSLSYISLFSSDLLLASASPNTSSPTIITHCLDLISSHPVDHSLNDRLASALLALLAVSVVLNLATTAVALFSGGSAFALPVFFPALVDECLLVAAVGIYLAIMNHEAGAYVTHERVHDVDGKSVLGVGFWLLVSALAVRVVSMPALVFTTVVVGVGVPLGVVYLIFAMCGGERDKVVVKKVEHITRVVYVQR